MLTPAGARPLPFSARTDFSFSFHTKANMSPPMPVELGSTTFRVAAVQMAASTALPPSIKIRRPAIAARGWLVATIPLVAITVERLESKYMTGDPNTKLKRLGNASAAHFQIHEIVT
jgi:hypothetical protein